MVGRAVMVVALIIGLGGTIAALWRRQRNGSAAASSHRIGKRIQLTSFDVVGWSTFFSCLIVSINPEAAWDNERMYWHMGLFAFILFVPAILRTRFLMVIPELAVIIVSLLIVQATRTQYEEYSRMILGFVAQIAAVYFCFKYAKNREYWIRFSYLTAVQLKVEEAKVQNLLLLMLPAQTIAKIRAEELIADPFDLVTILFAEIVDFTQHAQSMAATDLIALLNRVFSVFDQLTDLHDVFKVESIGQVYMAASGLPDVSQGHAGRVADLAFAMLQRITSDCLTWPDGSQICVKVGIHSGSVVAGVIGSNLPRYRLFGDTVNTASRMCTYGAPLRVHISAATHALLLHDFETQDRGDIQVKGKGSMHCHWLLGRKHGAKVRRNSANSVATVPSHLQVTGSRSPGPRTRPSTPKNSLAGELAAKRLEEAMASHAPVVNSPPEGTPLPAPAVSPAQPPPTLDKPRRLAPLPPIGLVTNLPAEAGETSALPGVPTTGEANIPSPGSRLWVRIPNKNSQEEAAAYPSPAANTAAPHSDPPPPTPIRQPPLVVASVKPPPPPRLSPSNGHHHQRHLNAVNGGSNGDMSSSVGSGSQSALLPGNHGSSTEWSTDDWDNDNASGTRKARSESTDSNSSRASPNGDGSSSTDHDKVRFANVTEVARFGSSLEPEKFNREADDQMRWPTLHFGDRVLENAFDQVYLTKFCIPARLTVRGLTIFCCIVHVILIGVHSEFVSAACLAYVIISVLGSILGLVLCWWERTSKWIQQIAVVTLCLLVSGVTGAFLEIRHEIGDPEKAVIHAHHWVHLVFIVVVPLFGGLQFVYCSMTLLFILCINLVTDDTAWKLVEWHSPNQVLCVASVIGMFVSLESTRFLRQDFLQNRSVQRQKDLALGIVTNLLPGMVARQLMNTQKQITVSQEMEEVSMLFADIVGFTTISSNIEPEQLVEMLKYLFDAFDQLSAQLGVYKVETIGDCYFCASGVPEAQSDHALRLAQMALRMQEVVSGHSGPNGEPLRFRVGLHTGPVVAGVVGFKMPRYHLFGEAVQTANSMESLGLGMCVNVSESFMRAHQRQDPSGSAGIRFDRREGEVGPGNEQMYWLIESRPLPPLATPLSPSRGPHTNTF